ncbi:MAG: S8 family serine peptidase [Coriobacteriia bacterium]|nr:S8 family serine peptidase [Coriobacteriia bacterium]
MRWVRTGRAAIALAVVLAAAGPAPTGAADLARTRSDRAEVIVSFDAGRRAEALAAIREAGGRVVRELRSETDLLVELPSETASGSARKRLLRHAAVRRVAPNGVLRPAWIPNDPLLDKQWALTMTGVPQAWDLTRGSGTVRVAVIDSGVDVSHPDLARNLDLVNDWDFVRNDGTADEEYPHGTHVAGIVGAVANNGQGIAGVAPGVKVLPIKIIDAAGIASTADFADAVRYAADKGAQIINASLGDDLDPSNASDAAEIAVLQEAVDYARSKGCLVVAAAGNGSGPPVWYPAACRGVVAVSAVARTGSLAPYSSTGSEVDLAAPGGYATSYEGREDAVLSTWNGGGYAYAAGTSMAAPHVAGIAALLKSARPDASRAVLEAALESAAHDLGVPGRDEQTGYGLVHAADSLALLRRVPRLAGADRYATAVAVSKAAFAAGSCPTVVMASGERYPDALAGAGLAGRLGSPVLLTRRLALPSDVLAELRRLGATKVLIVGEAEAVGAPVEEALRRAGLAVERLGGADRYATAALVAGRTLASRTGTATVFVVRGDEFADATVAGAPAAASASPVVLVKPDSLPSSAREAIEGAKPCRVVIVGGPAAVSDAVKDAIGGIEGVVGVERWSGTDRYETAAAVARSAVAAGLCARRLAAVASGADFPDALAGGAAAGAADGVVVLSRPSALPSAAGAYIAGQMEPRGTAWILGGAGALAHDVVADVIRALP